ARLVSTRGILPVELRRRGLFEGPRVFTATEPLSLVVHVKIRPCSLAIMACPRSGVIIDVIELLVVSVIRLNLSPASLPAPVSVPIQRPPLPSNLSTRMRPLGRPSATTF